MSCTDTCVTSGISTLGKIVEIIITGAEPAAAPTIIQLLTNALVTFQCKLPPNVVQTIKNELVLLQTISTTTLKQENTAYLTIIFGTFLLLTILCYVAMYIGGNAITICFVLSIIIIIVAVIVLAYWLDSIFTSSGKQVSTILTTIGTLLDNTIAAGNEAFCCLGSCSTCSTCPI